MGTQTSENNTLEKVIAGAVQLPGVKVNRKSFLCEAFKNAPNSKLNRIIEVGPVAAGCSRSELRKIAKSIIDKRTLTSTGMSFAAGLPGGLAMAASIPADTLQFYGVALRLAQELSYLYGEGDLWEGGELNEERVSQQLILYCGVMFGVSGASATIRVLSSTVGKQVLKKLPQKALTKTFYYPIVKQICKVLGVKMTKSVFAKGVSKAVPIIGGIVSGTITFASMRPMGERLLNEFDECKFDYTRAEFAADWKEVSDEDLDTSIIDVDYETAQEKKPEPDDLVSKLREYKSLLEDGIITEEEFAELKAAVLAEKKN